MAHYVFINNDNEDDEYWNKIIQWARFRYSSAALHFDPRHVVLPKLLILSIADFHLNSITPITLKYEFDGQMVLSQEV